MTTTVINNEPMELEILQSDFNTPTEKSVCEKQQYEIDKTFCRHYLITSAVEFSFFVDFFSNCFCTRGVRVKPIQFEKLPVSPRPGVQIISLLAIIVFKCFIAGLLQA